MKRPFRTSDHRHPAVDVQRLAGDICGLIRREINHSRGDICAAARRWFLRQERLSACLPSYSVVYDADERGTVGSNIHKLGAAPG